MVIKLFVFKTILIYFLLMDESILDETSYDEFVNNTWYMYPYIKTGYRRRYQDAKYYLRSLFWWNKSTKTKVIILLVVGLILYIL